jgi:hypothetical protein
MRRREFIRFDRFYRPEIEFLGIASPSALPPSERRLSTQSGRSAGATLTSPKGHLAQDEQSHPLEAEDQPPITRAGHRAYLKTAAQRRGQLTWTD